MDEAGGRVEPAEAGAGYVRGWPVGGGAAETRGLEEEQRDGREEQEDGPPPRHQPHGPLPQAARRLPPGGSAAGGRRRRPAAAASSSDTVMEMLRIVDDGIGGEALVGEVVGWAFTLWARTRVTLSWASLVVDRGHVPEPWTHHLAHIGLSTSPGWLGLANRTER